MRKAWTQQCLPQPNMFPPSTPSLGLVLPAGWFWGMSWDWRERTRAVVLGLRCVGFGFWGWLIRFRFIVFWLVGLVRFRFWLVGLVRLRCWLVCCRFVRFWFRLVRFRLRLIRFRLRSVRFRGWSRRMGWPWTVMFRHWRVWGRLVVWVWGRMVVWGWGWRMNLFWCLWTVVFWYWGMLFVLWLVMFVCRFRGIWL